MKNKIIHVLCEGQTEQGFVDAVLKPYLLAKGIAAVKSVLVTTNKKKNARGGMISFAKVQNDLKLLRLTCLDGDYERHIFTTMFDLYALPADFPGYDNAKKLDDRYKRVEYLEQSYAKEVDDAGFIPYIQLHEFEALVLCGIGYLKDLYPECAGKCDTLQTDIDKVGNPELVNDNPETAPSKRIIKAIEEGRKASYNKPSSGKYVTGKVGIDALRGRCQHFNSWIQGLIDC